jgi:DNA-directed RNA polymerase alpha subunit
MKKGEYYLDLPVGTVNAVRRALIMDIEAWAPDTVTFTRNSSCQTDEYIAHRIGLIPFVKVGDGDTMEISVKGRTLRASDLTGPAFKIVKDVEIIEMNEEQEITATVFFKLKCGHVHARYKMCSAVSMQILQNGMYKLCFETLNDEEPDAVLRKAICAIDSKIDRALSDVGNLEVC